MMSFFSPIRRVPPWFGLLLAITLAGVLAWFSSTRMGRELTNMPVVERRALYERTLETLRTSCAKSSGPEFTNYCHQQAAFIERFPECDDACRALARPFHPRPTR